jgi:hypothetical protein
MSRGLRSARRDDTPGTLIKEFAHPEGMPDRWRSLPPLQGG